MTISKQQSIADWVGARVSGGVKAALTAVTLNNGTLNVSLGTDITSQTTALSPDTGAYRWTENGSNFAALVMPFNTGATQTDFSGNSNTGTTNGATFTASGQVGGAMSFDGVDDYVSIADASTLDLNGPFTISTWLNTNNAASPQYAVSKWFGDHTAGGYIFGVSGGVAFVQKSNGSAWDALYTPASTITSDTWYHVVATWDGTTNAGGYRLYINGVVSTSGTATSASMLANNHPLTIGRYNFSVLNPWNGEIDEVHIYQRALSAAQVLQLYNDGVANVGGPTIIQSEETIASQLWNLTVTPITSLGSVGGAVASSNQTFVMGAGSTMTGSLGTAREDIDLDASITVPSGSVAGLQWKLNGTPWATLSVPFNSGASQTDISGNAYTVTNQGDAAYTASGCKVGGCLALDGANDYAVMGSTPFTSLTALTISAWVRSSTLGHIIANHNGCVAWESVLLDTGQFLLNTSNSGGTRTSLGFTSVADGQWHHVGALWTGTQMYVYVDGVLAAGPLAHSVQPWANPHAPYIGAYQDNCTPPASGEINGNIDELQIYRRALSAQQIQQLYTDGLGSGAAAPDGVGGPTSVSLYNHTYNEAWQLMGYEFFTSTGTIGGPVYIGSGTIGAAATTTITPTTPSGTQSRNITVQFTCSNADNAPRDFLIQYSTNGGGAYASATLVSTSSGTISGSSINGVTCNGSTQSFVWNSVANLVASGVLDNDVRIRMTTQINAAPVGETANFSVQNPFIITSTTTINSGDLTYDGSELICSGAITLTINGTHSFTALDLLNGCTLTHSSNTTTQTNVAVLTVSGNATVDATSTINVNGRGFQGGQTRCQAGSGPGAGQSGTDPGSGSSFPSGGASYGGRGGTGNNSNVAATYGSMSAPADLGSGGAGGGDYNCDGGTSTGGAGGGYIKLTVGGTFTLNGTVTANGNAGVSGVGPSGGGSGGSVWLDVATLAGNGTISANGGNPSSASGGAGGGGRIAIYYTTNSHSNIAGSTFAYGGSTTNAGSPGTIYIKPNGDNFGDLYMSNNNVASQYTSIISGVTQFDTMTFSNAANVVYTPSTLELDESLTIGGSATTRLAVSGTAFTSTSGAASITINSNGILSHDTNTTTRTNYLDISGIQHLTINSGGSVNVDGRGYRGGTIRCQIGAGPGAGVPGTDPGSGSSFPSGGASHGGRGGTGNNTSVAASYGSVHEPIELGSGGAAGGDYLCDGGTTTGGAGGGAVKIIGTGTLTLAGTISANGAVGTSGVGAAGGGAGGSVWLNFATITGSGTITANGANATASGGGAGGGGRVAVYFTTNTHTSLSTSIQSRGGSLTNAGGAGTVYLKDAADNFGELYASNGGTAGQYTTLYPSTGIDQFETITVLDAAHIIYQPTTLTIDELITIGGTASTTFSVSNTVVSSTSGIADIVINSNGVLSHDTNTTTQVNDLEVTGFRHTTINSGGSISVTGKGFQGGQTRCQNGSGTGGGRAGTDPGSGGSFPSGGGIYGGRGGNGNNTNFSTFYGSITQPSALGSGGAGGGDYGCDGGTTVGGAGGGYVKLVLSGTLTVNGSIVANGNTGTSTVGQAGGGSGGSIWLDVNQIAGSGTITADGGNPSAVGGGAGGGGRIAIYYNSNTHSNLIGSISVAGGSVSNYGSSGTAFVKDNGQSYGDFKADNNSFNSVHFTNLFVTGQPATYTFKDLYVIELAELLIDTPCSGLPAVTITGSTYLTGSGTITNNQSGTCTVSQVAINITTSTLPAGIVGVAYNQTLAGTGGYAPYSWVCRSGGVTVACSTVLPPGLSMSTAGVITGTPTTPGTYNFTVRATESSPGVAFDEQALAISVGNAPTSPINLFVGNASAQVGATNPSGIDASPVFSAEFSDPDLGDTGSLYRIQVASDAGFTSLLWDSGASGTALGSPCTNNARCVDIAYGGSTLSLTATTYHWRIKYWDNLGIEGPYSLGNTFTTDQAPTAPTALFSNDSNAQSGLTNPVGILAAHPVFSAVFNDPDLGDTATKFRVQVSTTNNFSAIVWDSGSGGTNMTSCNEGNRCADIVYGGTDLARDETTYYWRIKYWDVAGVEGAWSQDPTSTNTFKMGTGGGSIQVIQQQQQAPQPTVPEAPIAGAVEVLGPDRVRYNWIDVSANETGFRVLNAQNQVIADVPAGQTSAVESALTANALIEGRFVLAYNAIGQSALVPFASARTSAPIVRPLVGERGGDHVTFILEPAFVVQTGETVVFPGQTAVRFDIIVTNREGETRTLSSDWIQSNTYTFTGINPDEEIQVRTVTRNATGLQNEPTSYEDIGALSRRFVVSLGVFKKGTETLPRPMLATDAVSVRMTLTSVGTDPANAVTLNMPLPRYIKYVPGSLIVDGRSGSDTPGEQGTLANQNGISASWAVVHPGDSHTVAFELVYDLEDLRSLRDTVSVGTPDDVLAALVQAAANPLIHLQASVSFADSDAVYMSPIITLEPDVETAIEPLIEEVPAEEVLVEEQPVELPTPEETQIIEQILQQEFPAPTPTPQPGEPTPSQAPSPAPTLQTGETLADSDAGSFNLVVTGEDSKLGMTGSANVAGESIQFSGTTTEPFTVITLIFNNSITAIAVSDANGFWQTFVDADRLGILPGQEAQVKIEAIAAKGDLRSERVQVGDVTVSRGRSGDIAADFDTTVSDSPIVSVIEEIQHQVVRVVEEQEPVIKTTLTVSAPVVIVSSAPLWGYLPYVPTLIYHLITQLFGFIGRKKRGGAGRFYGVAYDSINKQPLALAIIRIYKLESALPQAASIGAAATASKKLVTTVVTDKLGRYDALLEPGQYTLEVAKPGYLFPSQIVTTELDGEFEHVYSNATGIKVEGDQISIPDVPLDPINAKRPWQLAHGGKKLWMAVQRVGDHLAAPILIVGSIVSALVVITTPEKPSNWIIAIMYIVLLALQVRFKPKQQKAWGVVYDVASNAILPLVTIQLIEPATSKVVTSRLSDYEGRFTFLPEPGSYILKASKPGFTQVTEVVQSPFTDRQPLTPSITISKPSERVSGDVPMKQSI